MSLTVPDGLAGVASLVGVPVGLFAWDEDRLAALGTAIGDYARSVRPDLAGTEQAAAQYTGANADASGDAFAAHWTSAAGTSETNEVLNTSVKVAAAIGIAAGAIKVAKAGVITYLTWCARQLAASVAGGVGALNAVRATLLTRAGIGKLYRKLIDKLGQLVMPHLRQANDLLRGAGARPVLAGARGATLRTPYKEHVPAMRTNMARTKGGDGDAAARTAGRLDPLPEAASGSTLKHRFETAEAADRLDSIEAQDLANGGHNN